MCKSVLLILFAIASALAQTKTAAPRVWNDRDLAEWATPIAALKVRPGHLSEAEFYSLPVAEWVRTYPVYMPGREPKGYWQMLQSKLTLLSKLLKSQPSSDWVANRRQ